MIDSQTPSTRGEPSGQKAQRRVVYTIVDRPNSAKGFWVKIGSAFVNHDNSINVYLDALPVNTKLHIREEKGDGYRPAWQQPDPTGGAS
jgi:hypothetical protein